MCGFGSGGTEQCIHGGIVREDPSLLRQSVCYWMDGSTPMPYPRFYAAQWAFSGGFKPSSQNLIAACVGDDKPRCVRALAESMRRDRQQEWMRHWLHQHLG